MLGIIVLLCDPVLGQASAVGQVNSRIFGDTEFMVDSMTVWSHFWFLGSFTGGRGRVVCSGQAVPDEGGTPVRHI